MRALGHADGDAVAQHGRPVAQVSHLGHPVGNENHRIAPVAPVSDHRVNALGEVRGKRRRDFVEQQHRRLGRKGAREIDEAQGRVGQVTNEEAEIEPDDAKFREPFVNRIVGGAGKTHVLRNSQVRHERGVLIDGDDVRGARFRRRSKRARHALDKYLAAIGGKDAGDDFHQRALACPV